MKIGKNGVWCVAQEDREGGEDEEDRGGEREMDSEDSMMCDGNHGDRL